VKTRLFSILAFAIGLAAAPSFAEATDPPWIVAERIIADTKADVAKSGVVGAGPHVADLEQALAGAASAKQQALANGIVLTDGMADTLLSLTAVASEKMEAARVPPHTGDTVALHDPYPMVSLYLGSYYNEIGKPLEAIRALDSGLALSTKGGIYVGDHVSYLLGEKGAAFGSLKRWPNALAAYDQGLALPAVPDGSRARLYRGRGYALTELGKLEEAEQAYRDSLTIEPGNPRAEAELKYIAGLRAGKQPVASAGLQVGAPQAGDAKP
jgi:tetratricopeptide (TPR) repeat protein